MSSMKKNFFKFFLLRLKTDLKYRMSILFFVNLRSEFKFKVSLRSESYRCPPRNPGFLFVVAGIWWVPVPVNCFNSRIFRDLRGL